EAASSGASATYGNDPSVCRKGRDRLENGAAPAHPGWTGGADRVVGLTLNGQPFEGIPSVPRPAAVETSGNANLSEAQLSRRNEGTSRASSGTSKTVAAGTWADGSGTSAPVETTRRRRRPPPKPVAMTVTRT